MAINAVRSLLAQDGCEFTVVVSDNSTREEDARQVAEFCEETADPRLQYIRPTQPLHMAAHWDWALQQVLASSDATHFGIHYDRKLAATGALAALAEVCTRDGNAVVTYPCDFTFATAGGLIAWQFPGTGRVFEIRTSRLVETTASGSFSDMGQPIPLLSNCMVPRAVLERVRSRFGDICNSATPDSSFTFRFCALEERYLHLDRALSVMYAFEFSNGLAYYRSDTKGTYGDFVSMWGDRPWLEAAPIPGLNLGLNIMFHEYNLVQRVAGKARFPPIERDAYLRELARGLAYIENPTARAGLQAMLEEHGWRPDVPLAPLRDRPLRRLARLLRRWLHPAHPRPSSELDLTTFRFADESSAVEYLLSHRRAFAQHNELLTLLEPVEVAFPQ